MQVLMLNPDCMLHVTKGILRVWRPTRAKKSIKIVLPMRWKVRERKVMKRGATCYGYFSFFFSRWSPRPTRSFDVVRFPSTPRLVVLLGGNVLSRSKSQIHSRYLLGFFSDCLDWWWKRRGGKRSRWCCWGVVFFDNVLRFFREKKKHIKISACSEFCFYSVRVEEPAKRVACCLSFLRRFFPQTARWRNFA